MPNDLSDSQRRELCDLEFELEKTRRRAELEDAKERVESEREEAAQRRGHEYWVEAQRRRIQAMRIDKARIAEEGGPGANSDDVDAPPPTQQRQYDFKTGFGARFDRVLASEALRAVDLDAVRLVYALYDGKAPCVGALGRQHATRWVHYDALETVGALLGAAAVSSFGRAAASTNLRLVVELQASRVTAGSAARSKKHSARPARRGSEDSAVFFEEGDAEDQHTDGRFLECLGWCAVPLFAEERDPALAAGAWLLPLARGNFDPDAPWPPLASGAMELHARFFHARLPVPAPPPELDQYKPWPCHVSQDESAFEDEGSTLSGKPSMATSQASSPPRQARESPRLGDEPPLVLRVFSAEVLDPDQWPRSVREVAVEAVLGSSAKPLWRAVDAVLEDGRLASWTRARFDVPASADAVTFRLLVAGAAVGVLAQGTLQLGSQQGSERTVALRDEKGKVLARLSVGLESATLGALFEEDSNDEGSTTATIRSGGGREDVVDEELGFLAVSRPPPVEPFVRGQGIDVFVDGARGLPDNAGASKVTLRLIRGAGGGEDLAVEESACCAVDGPRWAPRYGVVAEYRLPVFDPTATLLLRVDALDEDAPADDGTLPRKKETMPKCLGYALLNLFCSAGNASQQPKDKNAQGYCANAGGTQLALRRGSPDVKNGLRCDALDAAPKFSGATLLVRVELARTTPDGLELLSRGATARERWEELGLSDAAPKYADGAYDSSRCAVSAIEQELYRRRAKRSDPGVARSGHVGDALGADNALSGAALLDQARDFVNLALAPRPVAMLDHTRASAYVPDLGFSIAVDGINCLPPNDGDPACFYKVVTVVSPPGLFLREPSVAEDAQFTLTHDLGCAPENARFSDGLRRFRDKPKNPSLVAFFQVRSLTAAANKKDRGVLVNVAEHPSRCFWAALPILRRASRPTAFPRRAQYVDSGAFLLPLFRGPIPEAMLSAAHPGDALLDALSEQTATRAASKKRRRKTGVLTGFDLVTGGASLVVRLVDAQLEDLAVFAPPPARQEYATAAALAAATSPQDYAFNYAASHPKKALRKLVPRNTTDEVTLRELNLEFANVSGIRHYNFT